MALTGVALFLLLHPYAGLIHDARLYSIQALSHLHPDLYGNDVFIRFGSQDNYTLFSPLFAWATSLLGIEPAAALLTLVATCLFLTAAWAAARALLSPLQAGVALLLLLVIPAYYGPGRIFYFLEGFVTPRQLAEALTLFCLAAWFTNRYLLAIVSAGCAMLVHPIIGLAGIAFLAVLESIQPRWRRFWPWAAIAAPLIASAAVKLLPLSHWQFDAEWYEIVMRRDYLALRYWNSDDWGRVVTVICTLAVAGTVLENRLRAVAIAGCIAGSSLLVVALIGGDLLRIVIVVQAQTWRVLWLATVLAILLLPPMFMQGWRGAPLTRCALLLVAAAWAAHYATPALITAPLALLAAASASRPISPTSGRLLMSGAWLALALVVLYSLGTSLLSWNDGLTQLVTLPPLLDEILTFGQSGVAPALILVTCGYLALHRNSRLTLASLSVVALGIISVLARPAIQNWTARNYTDSLRQSFAEWRALIPPGTDVMWVGDESLWGDGAVNSWLLLERPSFISGAQAPNALFSRSAAIEMRARSQAIWGLLPFNDPFRPKNESTSRPPRPLRLAPLCETSTVRYVVTQETMIDSSPIPPPASAPPVLRDYKLYICT